jgi:hypothetical protein
VVDGETIIFNGGGDVVRARDGKIVLRAIGWGGSGNAPAALQQKDGSSIVAFNQGGRRWSPRPGHQVVVYRITRKGDDYQADKLWEWGYDGSLGGMASSPVIVAGKLFIGGSQGYVFDLMSGASLIAPLPPVNEASDKKFRAANKGVLMRTDIYLNPIATADKVFLTEKDGTITVVSPELAPVSDAGEGAPKWKAKVLAVNRLVPEKTSVGSLKDVESMARWTIATPQVREDCLYVRQNGWLWCVGLRQGSGPQVGASK